MRHTTTARQDGPKSNGAHLLVIASNPQCADSLATAFDGHYRVDCATTVPDGLELARKVHPAVVLLDVSSPEIDGINLCRLLRNASSTRDVPILFLGAQPDAELELHAFASGASDFMPKPYEPMILRARIQKQIEVKNRLDQLIYLCTHDPLTGLANRRALFDHLALEWRRTLRNQRPIALLMVDIDCFKPYNDYFGHLEGDECLIRIAEAIAKTASRAGDLVARYGGEEFAVVLADTDREQAMTIAERICARIHSLNIPHPASDAGDQVSVSIGVASAHLIHEPGSAIDASKLTKFLLKAADKALYDCKRTGKNRIAYAAMPTYHLPND